jgi:4'-phosphopantetheinyl transferase
VPTAEDVWPGERNPVLRNGDVDVWLVDLDSAGSRPDELASVLSADEEERAARFVARKDRERFIVARGLLRTILGDYLSVPPSDLRFSYGAFGKPALATGAKGGHLEFNLAHSGPLALLAISWGRRIGVDVEQMDDAAIEPGIVDRFFSPQEASDWRALPSSARSAAFFATWTRKEAYLKARGEGLAASLRRFTVSVRPDERVVLRDCEWDPEEASRWSLLDLAAGRGYAAALAIEGCDVRLRFSGWERSGGRKEPGRG